VGRPGRESQYEYPRSRAPKNTEGYFVKSSFFSEREEGRLGSSSKKKGDVEKEANLCPARAGEKKTGAVLPIREARVHFRTSSTVDRSFFPYQTRVGITLQKKDRSGSSKFPSSVSGLSFHPFGEVIWGAIYIRVFNLNGILQ